jgi:hypothetical protein
MIIHPFRSAFYSLHRAAFRLCLESDCDVQSHFRGRTSCCRDEHRVQSVHVLNTTDLFLAYFTFRVAGFVETLFFGTIRRLRTVGVNGEKRCNSENKFKLGDYQIVAVLTFIDFPRFIEKSKAIRQKSKCGFATKEQRLNLVSF